MSQADPKDLYWGQSAQILMAFSVVWNKADQNLILSLKKKTNIWAHWWRSSEREAGKNTQFG